MLLHSTGILASVSVSSRKFRESRCLSLLLHRAVSTVVHHVSMKSSEPSDQYKRDLSNNLSSNTSMYALQTLLFKLKQYLLSVKRNKMPHVNQHCGISWGVSYTHWQYKERQWNFFKNYARTTPGWIEELLSIVTNTIHHPSLNLNSRKIICPE